MRTFLDRLRSEEGKFIIITYYSSADGEEGHEAQIQKLAKVIDVGIDYYLLEMYEKCTISNKDIKKKIMFFHPSTNLIHIELNPENGETEFFREHLKSYVQLD